MSNEINWMECYIHDEAAEGEDKDFLFNLFAPEKDPYDSMEFHFPNLSTITLRGQIESPNSTGLGLWLAAEFMCGYLVENPDLIIGKQVLELGAGMGLPGLVSLHLGASRVLLTDGDSDVLANLRHNVNLNNITTWRIVDFLSSVDLGKESGPVSKSACDVGKRLCLHGSKPSTSLANRSSTLGTGWSVHFCKPFRIASSFGIGVGNRNFLWIYMDPVGPRRRVGIFVSTKNQSW